MAAVNACVFSHFSVDGSIADYVYFYLEALSNADCEIAFVSTSGKLEEYAIQKLSKICAKVIVRQNIGFDFASYREGIKSFENLGKFSRLVLANDSVFGPFSDIKKVIEYGDANQLEMWGATDSFERSYHAQSYFLVYSNKLFTSQDFRNFWREVGDIDTSQPGGKDKIITKYEIGGTEYFQKLGYSVGAFCSYETIKSDLIKYHDAGKPVSNLDLFERFRFVDHIRRYPVNLTHFMWDILIKHYGFPFLKRELFTVNPSRVPLAHWREVVSETGYDVELVLKAIYPILKERNKVKKAYDYNWLLQPLDIPNTDLKMPLFLSMLLTVWPDLVARYNMSFASEQQSLNTLAWWESPGRNANPGIVWPEDGSYPHQLLEDAESLTQDTYFKISKGLLAVWNTRLDFQRDLPIDSKDGRNGLIHWWLFHGFKEYRFLKFSDEHLRQFHSPSDADPRVPKILHYLFNFYGELEAHLGSQRPKSSVNLLDWWSLKGRLEFPQFFQANDARKESEVCLKREMGANFYSESFGSYEKGVSISGFSRGNMGVGEDVRSAYRCFEALGVRASTYDVPIELKVESLSDDLLEVAAPKPKHDINIFCLPASETYRLLLSIGPSLFDRRYNIGAWQWELSRWPDNLEKVFNLVQEIWTISDYNAEMFKRVSPIPVINMSLAVDLPEIPRVNRAEFGLDDAFTFLMMFDGNSWLSRKNPIAGVLAFKRAFPNKRENVKLVIKTMNVDSRNVLWRNLLDLIKGDERIKIINQTFERQRGLALLDSCDCYVSLHRAEGFGRIIAEAMLLRRPVIVSDYSGNKEFNNSLNSYLVDGELVPLKKNEYHQWEGQHWFDPSVESAAKQMRQCFENPIEREIKSENGQRFIKQFHSYKAIGEKYVRRLTDIGLL